MKFNKWTLALGAVVCGIALLAMSAGATLGFDTYKAARTYVITPIQNLTPANSLTTNGPVDLVKMVGTSAIFLDATTNSANSGGTLTAQLYGSNDQTNLTALANYWLITSPTTVSVTNFYYGGTNGLTAANSELLPGTTTYPNAAVSGWATPYLNYSPATNTGAITLGGVAKTVEIGINTDDQPRYLYIVYTTGGTVTNFTTSAKLVTVNFAQ